MRKFMKQIACLISVAACCSAVSVTAFAAPPATPAVSAPPAASTVPEASPEASQAVQEDKDTPDASEHPLSSEEPTASGEPSPSVSPEASPSVSPSGTPAPTSDTLDFNINITYRRYVIDSFIKIEVYNSQNELVGTQREWVGGITRNVKLHYDVPEYTLGEVFSVKLESGAESLAYYDKKISPGERFEIQTGGYTNDDNNFVAENKFNFDAVPRWEKEVIISVNDKELHLAPRARIVDGTAFVPVRQAAKAMGLDVSYNNEYNSVTCRIDDKKVYFNLDTTYATFFGETTYLPAAPRFIQNCAYVPVRSLAEAFGAPVTVSDHGARMNIDIGESEVIKEYFLSDPINTKNVSSRTNYMVWVSKSEYKVRLYEGSENRWKLIHTAPCAIGAPGTPTVTGSFEYIERTQWDYGTYYVGPVLRFYNGYALHSTLLYYGGGEYDGRVGVKISHGCIRLHPQDINLIADTIPFRTRIYITE